MASLPLHPLRFEPIFKSMLWGGRRLPEFLRRPHSGDDPVGEAWVVSDVNGQSSRVADGPLAGTTLHELLLADPARMKWMGVQGRQRVLREFTWAAVAKRTEAAYVAAVTSAGLRARM